MTNAIQKIEPIEKTVGHFDDAQLQLLKNTVCKGASDDELKFFIHACQRTGLDPFSKQIYSVPRAGQRTIQVGIDGYRLIAERTGRYCPGRASTFKYNDAGKLLAAEAYIKKQTKDGSWHEISAEALYDEYNANNPMWKKMPHAMLSKCAECLALRKAFPNEMSGTYSNEEMQQADVVDVTPKKNAELLEAQPEIKKMTQEQAEELYEYYHKCSPEGQEKAVEYLENHCKVKKFEDAPDSQYVILKRALSKRAKEFQDGLKEETNENN